MAKATSPGEPQFVTTRTQVDEFERIVKQLEALHGEFIALAKSKPDNPINKFKLRMLNEKIVSANVILSGVFKPFEQFSAFDEADLPTNSDVSLVLTTYLASLERWRSAHVGYDDNKSRWLWKIQGTGDIPASPSTRHRPEGR